MLNLNLDPFLIELTDGSIRNVGASNKTASAKLFDVEAVEARAFGDSQLKIVAIDESGNEVQIALFPEQAAEVAEDIETLRSGGSASE